MTTLIQILGRVENDLTLFNQRAIRANQTYEALREETDPTKKQELERELVKRFADANHAIESYFNSSRVLGDTSEKHNLPEATFNCPPGGKPVDILPSSSSSPWDNISTMGMDRTNHGSPI
jgi:hypothetical protein